MKKIGFLIFVMLLISINASAENIDIVTDLPTKEIEFHQENAVLVGDTDG